MTLLKMSGAASALILIILLLRAALLNKLPKRTFKLLWAVVMARMLLPIFLPVLPAEAPHSYPAAAADHAAAVQTTDEASAAPTAPAPKAHAFPKFDDRLLTVLWAAGFLSAAAIVAVRHRRSMLSFKTAPACRIKLISDMAEDFGLKRKILIKTSDEISSPMTCGIIHPTILIPDKMQTLSADQLELVLAHEIMHIKKLDLLYKHILMTAVCVHWFNPLAWVMLSVANTDIELACDEAVIAARGDIRREYAMTLIGLEERRISLLTVGLGAGSVKERIVAIMKYKKVTAAATAASAIIVLGSLAAFAANDSNTDTYEEDKQIVKITTIDDEGNITTVYETNESDGTVTKSDTAYDNETEVIGNASDIRYFEDGTGVEYDFEILPDDETLTAESELVIETEAETDDIMTPTVPNVVGMNAEEARQTLEAAGYLPMIRERYYDADDVPAGKVGEVKPAPGTDLAKGSEVQYFVSVGPVVPPESD